MARVRTQVYLEKSQYERLRAEAFKQKLSLSELLRRLIQQAFGPKRLSSAQLRRKALGFVGKGRDSDSDVARHHDKYLAGL